MRLNPSDEALAESMGGGDVIRETRAFRRALQHLRRVPVPPRAPVEEHRNYLSIDHGHFSFLPLGGYYNLMCKQVHRDLGIRKQAHRAASMGVPLFSDALRDLPT